MMRVVFSCCPWRYQNVRILGTRHNSEFDCILPQLILIIYMQLIFSLSLFQFVNLRFIFPINSSSANQNWINRCDSLIWCHSAVCQLQYSSILIVIIKIYPIHIQFIKYQKTIQSNQIADDVDPKEANIPRIQYISNLTKVIKKFIAKIEQQVQDNVIPVSTGLYTQQKLINTLQAIPKPVLVDYDDPIFHQITQKQTVRQQQACLFCHHQFNNKNKPIMCRFCKKWTCEQCLGPRKRLHPRDNNPNGPRFDICSFCDEKYLSLQLNHPYVQNRMLIQTAIVEVSKELEQVQQKLETQQRKIQAIRAEPKRKLNMKHSILKKQQLEGKKNLKKLNWDVQSEKDKRDKLRARLIQAKRQNKAKRELIRTQSIKQQEQRLRKEAQRQKQIQAQAEAQRLRAIQQQKRVEQYKKKKIQQQRLRMKQQEQEQQRLKQIELQKEKQINTQKLKQEQEIKRKQLEREKQRKQQQQKKRKQEQEKQKQRKQKQRKHEEQVKKRKQVQRKRQQQHKRQQQEKQRRRKQEQKQRERAKQKQQQERKKEQQQQIKRKHEQQEREKERIARENEQRQRQIRRLQQQSSLYMDNKNINENVPKDDVYNQFTFDPKKIGKQQMENNHMRLNPSQQQEIDHNISQPTTNASTETSHRNSYLYNQFKNYFNQDSESNNVGRLSVSQRASVQLNNGDYNGTDVQLTPSQKQQLFSKFKRSLEQQERQSTISADNYQVINLKEQMLRDAKKQKHWESSPDDQHESHQESVVVAPSQKCKCAIF